MPCQDSCPIGGLKQNSPNEPDLITQIFQSQLQIQLDLKEHQNILKLLMGQLAKLEERVNFLYQTKEVSSQSTNTESEENSEKTETIQNCPALDSFKSNNSEDDIYLSLPISEPQSQQDVEQQNVQNQQLENKFESNEPEQSGIFGQPPNLVPLPAQSEVINVMPPLLEPLQELHGNFVRGLNIASKHYVQELSGSKDNDVPETSEPMPIPEMVDGQPDWVKNLIAEAEQHKNRMQAEAQSRIREMNEMIKFI